MTCAHFSLAGVIFAPWESKSRIRIIKKLQIKIGISKYTTLLYVKLSEQFDCIAYKTRVHDESYVFTKYPQKEKWG